MLTKASPSVGSRAADLSAEGVVEVARGDFEALDILLSSVCWAQECVHFVIIHQVQHLMICVITYMIFNASIKWFFLKSLSLQKVVYTFYCLLAESNSHTLGQRLEKQIIKKKQKQKQENPYLRDP
jgi:hypothetical protein